MPKSTHNSDEYLSPDFYNQNSKTRDRGFESFEHEDEYYFCYYEDAKVVLLSQGYTAEAGRDNGIKSVKKNMKLKERYRFTEREAGQHGFILLAGNHQEIAISRDFATRETAENIAGLMNGSITVKANIMPFQMDGQAKENQSTAKSTEDKTSNTVTTAKAAHLASLGASAAAKPILAKTPEKLVVTPDKKPTAKSVAKPVIAPKAPIAALAPALAKRPAGGVTPVAVAPTVQPATRVAPAITAPAATTGSGVTGSRIMGSGVTVGGAGGPRGLLWLVPLLLLLAFLLLGYKSCADAARPKTPSLETVTLAPKFVAEPKVEPIAPSPELITEPSPEPKAQPISEPTAKPISEPISESITEATPKATSQTPPEKTSETTSKPSSEALPDPVIEPMPDVTPSPSAPETATPQAVTSQAVMPQVETPKVVAPKIVTSSMTSMACSSSDNALFNVPPNMTPVSVTRLGTMPEFGDSHGLTPLEFYDKLTNRYLTRQYDQQYLDFLFRSIGYENGFKDATPQMFSNVTLEQGAKGVLGMGEFHGMQVSQLNVKSARDLEAFNIKAANGQNVNFMKTCGNFMYVCQ